MNKLQLCQRLQTDAGVSGTLTTTIGQTGSLGRLVNWIDDAWNNLQTERDDWEFLRSSYLEGNGFSFSTVSGQSVYPLGFGSGGAIGQFIIGRSAPGGNAALPTFAQFGKWARETFRCQSTSGGFQTEVPIDWVPYDNWRDYYMLGAMRSVKTRPIVMAVGPDKSICLAPPSDGTYTITGDYYMAPAVMQLDTDFPVGIATRFHLLIVYDALDMYADYESAPEASAFAAKGRAKLLPLFESQYLPDCYFAGALA